MSLIGEIINYYKLPDKIRSGLSKYANAHRVIGDLDIYVSDDIGSDTNDGLTVLTPFLTIQKAVDEVKTYIVDSDASITINVAAGNYILTEQISVDLLQGDNVSIIGADPVTTTLLAIDNNGTGDWSRNIVLEVGNSTGMSAGDHLMITGCDDAYINGQAEMNGTWEIVSFPSSNHVAIKFDHAHEYWNVSPIAVNPNYPALNPPATGPTSATVRVLKTRITQTTNTTVMRIQGANVALIDNIAIEQDTASMTDTSRLGIVAINNSIVTIGENVSVRKCYRGINAHSGSRVNISAGCLVSTNVNGFFANINAIFYITGETYASNNYHGYYAIINATITSNARPRAYNNDYGMVIGDSSIGYFDIGITTRMGLFGIWITKGSSVRAGDAGRHGFNYDGVTVRRNSYYETTSGMTSNYNSHYGVVVTYNSTIVMASGSSAASNSVADYRTDSNLNAIGGTPPAGGKGFLGNLGSYIKQT